MLRKMASKYAGRCKQCRKPYKVGDTIYWSPTTKAVCFPACGESKTEPNGKQEEKIAVSNVKLPASVERGNETFFTIDWADFKEILKDAAFNKKVSAMQNISNASRILSYLGRESFSGATDSQIKRWLTDGFQTDAIKGLAEFIPPIREKRRLKFTEEGDEFHIDLAWSGADEYMSEWTKREVIPGVAIEASIMFAGSVPAKTVAAYNVWICKTAYSLEAAGVDCQVTLDFPSRNLFERDTNRGQLVHNIVRVKKENETSDFLSWSPMLSPAALRVFGFSLGCVHADAAGKTVTHSFGNGIHESTKWAVEYDEDRRVIQIKNAYMDSYSDFPEESMTRQLRDVLKKLNSK